MCVYSNTTARRRMHLPGLKVFDIFNDAIVLAPFRIIPFDTNPYARVIRDLISEKQTNKEMRANGLKKNRHET